MSVKKAIFDLVTFRKDCVFFRDYGVGLTTFAAINEVHASLAEERNYFVADYATSYMINDPSTRKNIEVTMLYDLAAVAVNHFENNAFAPFAGIINGMILSNAIKGTVNFVPVNTPAANQKEAIDNIRVNYAIFENGQCVVQSLYTDNGINTQLTYINNLLSMQEIGRQIRIVCPEARYAISADGADFSHYNNLINAVLEKYQGNFKTLELVYTADPRRAAQKIYYAAINFQFMDWAQSELFDLVAMPVDLNAD
jgi:hypothetical protein